jgi:hypothetical protein
MPANGADLRQAENSLLANSGIVTEPIDVSVPADNSGNSMVVVQGQQLATLRFDMWSVLEDLLRDPVIAESLVWKFSWCTNQDGQRSIGELHTGDWWREQQLALGEDANILAVIVYADETTINLKGRSLHPVYLTLGNIPWEYRFGKFVVLLRCLKCSLLHTYNLFTTCLCTESNCLPSACTDFCQC